VASFYVENFGCRATQADGAAIERQFRERGLRRAQAPAQAEIVVLNTCTVTAAADQDARAAIRRIHRQNPGCQIVVTGCYAQRAPDEIAAIPGVTQIIGNSHKHRLAEIAVSSGIAGAVNADVSWEGHGFSRAVNQEKSPALPAEVHHFVPITTLTSKSRSPIFISDIFAHSELLAAPVFDAANERTRPTSKFRMAAITAVPSVSYPTFAVIAGPTAASNPPGGECSRQRRLPRSRNFGNQSRPLGTRSCARTVGRTPPPASL